MLWCGRVVLHRSWRVDLLRLFALATLAFASSCSEAGPALARDALGTLQVKGRAPKTGYSREQFGRAWSEEDLGGCDTRNRVLRRDLAVPKVSGERIVCVVQTGTLTDPYSGDTIVFVRGPASANIQIDHVVALSNAWQTGAQGWDAAKRQQFANDPANLLAVSGRLNQQKGAGDAATWLPPRRSFRCSYVARQVAIKQAYGLWVTIPERNAIDRILRGCPRQRIPRV